jgi:hypothetical protein|tara:strand:- start:62 stop:274 length:213 start_codon:yes stop_codon:yes gene_type:complete
MSKLFEEAENIISLERNLTVDDYAKFKNIQKQIPKNLERDFAWLGEGLFQRLPEIAKSFGSYDFLEDEDK